jgi:hypothetical protein
MAFKVKTTAPKLYCVRPNSGVLAPGESEPVTIIFQGLPEEPTLGTKCKDKFLFVSLPAPDTLTSKDVSSKWSELEKLANGNTNDVKLKVVFNYDNPMNTITEEEKSAYSIEPPHQPISQIPVKATTPKSETISTGIDNNITEPQQRKSTVPVNENSQEKLEPVKKSTFTGVAPPTATNVKSSNETSIYIIAIIFIILAFLISRFF